MIYRVTFSVGTWADDGSPMRSTRMARQVIGGWRDAAGDPIDYPVLEVRLAKAGDVATFVDMEEALARGEALV